MKLLFLIKIVIILFLYSCSNDKDIEKISHDLEVKSWLDSVWLENTNFFPVKLSEYGFKSKDSLWDDISYDFHSNLMLHYSKQVEEISKRFDIKSLNSASTLSLQKFLYDIEMQIAEFDYFFHNYQISQMNGWHTKVPSVLINVHTINNKNDADNYLKRISKIPDLFNQLIENIKKATEKEIIPPNFILKQVIETSQNMLIGKPLSKSNDDHIILEDFKIKINNIKGITESEKIKFLELCKQGLIESLLPAYNDLIDYLKSLLDKADAKAGVWKLPNGNEYYNFRLKYVNDIEIEADNIFNFGMEEVKRIHSEMDSIKHLLDFNGSLSEFFEFMKTDKKFFYSNDAIGKTKYLEKTRAIINQAKTKIDNYFNILPKSDVIVKAVEEYREKNAGKAFYEPPSLDGKRSGIYYVNLYDISQMPNYQIEALAFHEAIPGHHMQIAIAQELEFQPKTSSAGRFYMSFGEGWALYTELLAKEMKLYENLYSEFGRLNMELWRACRLVVDVGIHKKKWSREEAIDFYLNNTPNKREDAQKMVDRHIVMPGQATAYKIGMQKILELRTKAIKKLGSKFNLSRFHDYVLQNGSIPLFMLEDRINNYIDIQKLQNNIEGDLDEKILILTNPGKLF